MKCIFKKLFPLIIILAVFVPVGVSAYVWTPGQPVVPCDGVAPPAGFTGPTAPGTGPCDFDAMIQLGQNLVTILLYLAIPVAAISFSYAGFLYLTAAGDTGKISQAHGIFGKVMVGLIFALAAWLIVYAITSAFLSEDYSLLKE